VAAVGEAGLTFSGYCRLALDMPCQGLAAQAMLQTAMEVEARDFIGRAGYERGQEGQSVYRNGYKARQVATGEGPVELHVPQTRAGPEPFQTAILEAYRRRSETLEALIPALYVKGLSVRDVSDTFAQVFADEGVSPATASRIGQTIHQDFQAWQTRSLAGYELLYLFVEGMYLKLHPERDEKQPVLIAYGILTNGSKVLLHVGVGDRESYEACP